jgi:hypothetical protein
MLGLQVESEGAIQALQDFNKARQFMIRMVHPAQQVRRAEWPLRQNRTFLTNKEAGCMRN